MKQVFRAHRLCKQDGPLGPYIDSCAAEMRSEGYARQTREVQIRSVADFGRWLAKRGIQAQKITAELFRPYLRARARRRRPTRNDLSALQRLLDLLVRQGVVSPPVSPVATPAERLQSEFRLYWQQERALASTTQACYPTLVGEFLTEGFGTGPVDLSGLCAADVTGFVRRRAATIQSKRVQSTTTAPGSFPRFARYRGDIDKDLAACVPAVAHWKLSTMPRALPPDQVELVPASINRKTAMGRRDRAILSILARLGWRAAEIGTLTLEDLDWQAGSRAVRGKAGRCFQLPLPTEVGAAIADYLRHGRPPARSRFPKSIGDQLPGGSCAGAGRDRFSWQRRPPVPPRTRLSDAAAGSVVVRDRRTSPPSRPADHSDLREGRSGLAGDVGAAVARRRTVTAWRKAVEDYADLRRSLGFKLLEAKVGSRSFALFLKQRRAEHSTILRAPRNGPGGSPSSAALLATGAPMIHKPRSHHPACCLTGLGGHTRTGTAKTRSENCFSPRDGCRRLAVCGARPITVCWGCWP
jgi:site-specific recombinase XerD